MCVRAFSKQESAVCCVCLVVFSSRFCVLARSRQKIADETFDVRARNRYEKLSQSFVTVKMPP